MNRHFSKTFFLLLATISLSNFISPPWALFMGIVFAQVFTHPFAEKSSKLSSWLLKAAVVGLGFGISATDAIQAGKDGLFFTIFTIIFTLLLGILLGKLFKVESNTAYLIAGGTAICGGSAIAALAPIIKAKNKQISVALGVIFVLNSLALFVFPYIGHLLNMSPQDFGVWSAIAIHDTSSVVGAATKFNSESLAMATTVKLTRALWIIPLALLSALIFKQKNIKIQLPYFIALFVIAIMINSFVPGFANLNPIIVYGAKKALALTLFLIGTSLSWKTLKSVGISPILQGTVLWLSISASTLAIILFF
ncbi:MAG: putative sulfate exporter family transporter [Fibrobacter sp.]|nr:putative sulfate exporter family transporter [Fibrobacter sp.]